MSAFPYSGGGGLARIRRINVIGLRHLIHPDVPATGLHSLAVRQREIRRRRHSPIRTLAAGAGWGIIILIASWLLLSGIFGFPSA